MKRVVQLLVVAACLLTTVPAHAWSGDPLQQLPRVTGDQSNWHFNGPVVFVRTLDGDADLWSVAADGSDLHRLTSSRRSDTEPAWFPKGSKVVFVRSTPKGQDLYTLDVRGGRPTLFLTDGEAPAWSPDGSRLAFSRTVEGNTDVYSISADGTDLQRLTTDTGVDTDPWWGPDGTRVTFASDRDGDFDIYAMDPDGSNQRALTDSTVDERDPRDSWTWRDIGYNQGTQGDQLWCWQWIGPPFALPGDPWVCDDSRGGHSYSGVTWSPFAWLVAETNGRSHLWVQACCDPARQLTFGRRTDSDPAVRPAGPATVAGLSAAAGDLDIALRGAQAWVETHGDGSGADEGPDGLITVTPGLCLVDASEASSATTSSCDAGTGTGSTSVYADAHDIAFARDTGVGICLWAHYASFGGETVAKFGSSGSSIDCTGANALYASAAGW